MATKNGLVQIKDLIKRGSLSSSRSYRQGFLTSCHKAGTFELTMYNNFVYFTARIFGNELPFRNYRVNRNTTLCQLFEDLENA